MKKKVVKKTQPKKVVKNQVSKKFVTSRKDMPKGKGLSVANTYKNPQLGFGFTKKPGLS